MENGGLSPKGGDREVKDGETLLDHLVNYTEGKLLRLFEYSYGSRFMYSDLTLLKDEAMNIMMAGRMCHLLSTMQYPVNDG